MQNKHPAITGTPSAETAVYLLLGLLWDRIPYQFTFEEFEVSPRKQKYNHTKHLDARGKEFVDGQWVDVNFEFKLKSSGVLSDLRHHPDFHATWLICWQHDAPDAEKYVDRVLCLEDIFNKLSEEEKSRLICSPGKIVKLVGVKTPIPELVERFSVSNRGKVERFLELWPFHVQSGTSEIVLTKNGKPKIRLVAYSSEHVLIKETIPIELRQILINKFSAEEMEVNDKLKILLNKLDNSIIDRIMEVVNRLP